MEGLFYYFFVDGYDMMNRKEDGLKAIAALMRRVGSCDLAGVPRPDNVQDIHLHQVHYCI